jgi:uncharacterized membrane protein
MKYLAGLVFVIGAVITAALSLLRFKSIPDHVPMHWGLSGQPDRFGSRTEALIFVPCMLLFMAIIFSLVGIVSGKRLGSNAVRGINIVSIAVTILMIFVHNSLLSQNHSAIPTMIPIFMSGLLVVLGFAIRGIEPNPFIGIRVPWTMRSPMVWRLAHERASKLWIFGGIIALLVCLSSSPMVVPILIFVGCMLFPLLDSYRISKTG